MAGNYNICLDVGGTKVLGAIFDEKDKIIYRLKKRSKSGGSESADVEKVIIDVVEEMMVNRGVPDAEIENYRSHDSDDEKMYILSNSISHFGANLILYDDILHDIAFGMDSDLYLMMPSIDEILIIKAAPQVDPEVLAGFLCDIHSDEEDEAKKLSDCVYLYSLSTRKIFPMVSQSRCV